MFCWYWRSMSPGGTTTFAFIASASTSRYRSLRFSGIRYCSLCLSKRALTSASVTVTSFCTVSGVKTTICSFTFSFR